MTDATPGSCPLVARWAVGGYFATARVEAPTPTSAAVITVSWPAGDLDELDAGGRREYRRGIDRLIRRVETRFGHAVLAGHLGGA